MVDGVFIAIGHTPTTELFRGHLAMDRDGYIRPSPARPALRCAASSRRVTSRTRFTVRR